MKKKYIFVLIAVILWGLTYLLLGDLLKRFPPSELLVVRFSGSFVLTGLAMLLFPAFRAIDAAQTNDSQMMSRTTLVSLALLAGLFLGLASITQKYGIQWTGKPIHAAFLSALVALFVPVVQKSRNKLFPQSRPASFRWRDIRVPLALALIGTALLCEFAWPSLGDGLVILCAVFYALQIDLAGAFKKKWPPAYTQICGCISCIVLGAAIALCYDSPIWVFPASTWDWIGLALLTIGSTFIPWFLIHWSVQKEEVDPYIVGILYTLEPVVTLAVGYPMGVEALSLIKLLGCLLILWATERTCRL